MSEAKSAMAEVMHELKNGYHQLENKLSLGEYVDYWLENYIKTNTKLKAAAEYEKGQSSPSACSKKNYAQ